LFECRNSQDFSELTSFSQAIDVACVLHFSWHLLLINTITNGLHEHAFPTWTPPERMTASERLDELAQILCVGLRRILPEQSSSLSAPAPDSLVDFSPLKSGVRRHKLRNRVGG
jgi:hypothetical protein